MLHTYVYWSQEKELLTRRELFMRIYMFGVGGGGPLLTGEWFILVCRRKGTIAEENCSCMFTGVGGEDNAIEEEWFIHVTGVGKDC
ncbi:hypothetical protein AVEN_188901-1 [Araneus ventricosus]|uniref:Uncharacterized protein n=1 Tax=Araneus ventricosus TaxID=182803 RepID=A0A4Y2P6E7_ARAVE|nr:hypothetical protein AVEN_188901-1 [Araneus ventricosus]